LFAVAAPGSVELDEGVGELFDKGIEIFLGEDVDTFFSFDIAATDQAENGEKN